ncbi:hypothetical protein, partial [Streptomyces olivaceoviridis]|uniref:hypothetical protein n=1 Tax=Streptomyces olivaceoviridis TaxID=1921 RepID=UPI003329F4CD
SAALTDLVVSTARQVIANSGVDPAEVVHGVLGVVARSGAPGAPRPVLPSSSRGVPCDRDGCPVTWGPVRYGDLARPSGTTLNGDAACVPRQSPVKMVM